MKKRALVTMAVCIVLGNLTAGCTCLKDEIRKDLDTNPTLLKQGIKVEVLSVSNGYATIDVREGLSDRAICAIRQEKSLGEIALFIDKKVGALIEVEEVLKKRPEVKGVDWRSVFSSVDCGGPAIGRGIDAGDFCFRFVHFLMIAAATLVFALISGVFIVRRKRSKGVPPAFAPQSIAQSTAPDRVCPQCGTRVKAAAAFCGGCGARA